MKHDDHVASAEATLERLFARYEAKTADVGRALRAKLRTRLPELNELVYLYENQNKVVIAYSPTANGPDGVCSIALDPECVKLSFNTQGGVLSKSDPSRLLQGKGKAVRFVVLDTAADFDRPEIQALMAATLKLAKLQREAGAQGSVIFKAGAEAKGGTGKKKPARPPATRRAPKSRR